MFTHPQASTFCCIVACLQQPSEEPMLENHWACNARCKPHFHPLCGWSRLSPEQQLPELRLNVCILPASTRRIAWSAAATIMSHMGCSPTRAFTQAPFAATRMPSSELVEVAGGPGDADGMRILQAQVLFRHGARTSAALDLARSRKDSLPA